MYLLYVRVRVVGSPSIICILPIVFIIFYERQRRRENIVVVVELVASVYVLRRESQVRFVERERTLVFCWSGCGWRSIVHKKTTLIISYGIKY